MLQVGCASVNLIPDFPVCLHGYASRNYRTEKVEEPVELGCLALRNDHKTVLIFTVDIIGISYDTCELLYKDLEEAVGISYPDIYICGSHTHFAPSAEHIGVTFPGGEMPLGVYEPDQKFLSFLRKQFLAAAQTALAALTTVQVEYVDIPLPGIAFNRRTIKKSDYLVETNYLYPVESEKYDFDNWDDKFSVWRFINENGIVAILGRFSCHPVTGGSLGAEYMSGDYPYYFRKAVNELFSCPSFFMLGAAGDVVPMKRQGSSREDLGEILARSIRMNERRFKLVNGFSLKTAKLAIPVTMKHLLDRKKFALEYEEVRKKAETEAVQSDEFYAATTKMLAIMRYPSDTLTMPLQLLHFGEHILVGFPFECLSSIGERLMADCPNAILTSITGGYQGYLPLQEQFADGGYEVGGNHFMQNTGDRYLTAAAAKLKEFNAGERD